ncbi:PAS domain S-box protein [Sulfurimonas sp.]|uniref:PAS domain S-box protein n=1 Tax=Sulfurimonas sp. TaxID=2022749 RepID=UPI003D0F767C
MKTKFTYWLSISVLAVLFFGIIGFVYLLEETRLYPNIKLLHSFFVLMSFLSFVLFLAVLFWFFSVRRNEQNALKELQELNEENQLYFESATAGFLVVDLNRKILKVNPKLCKIFGYAKEDLLGKSTAIFHLDKAHYESWNQDIYKKAKQDEVIVIRYPVLHANGSKIWIDISGIPVYSSVKNEKTVLWTIIDVTDEMNSAELLQQYNEQLQENLSYLKTLINTAPIPIFIKDKNFRYEECNDAFLQLFKLNKEDVFGKIDREIFDLEFAQEIQEKDEELIEQLHQNYVLRKNDDGMTKVLKYYTNAIMLNDTLRGYIGFCNDITQTEEKELYLNLRVEQEVMKNLEMQRKHYKERMDDAKFTVIGKLAAGITHEINTPLTYVKGNIEILEIKLESMQNTDFKNDFLQISEGLKRIEGIVTSMREMSQQNGEAKEKVDVFDTVMMAITLGYNRSKQIATIEVQGKPFTFGMKTDEIDCYVLGQKQRLEQIWVVLLNNALDELDKHGKYDENFIRITCEHKDDFIVIRFEDSGKGIDAEILDKLFDPFVGHKEYGGIGIGLNIAKKIVEDHNGSIDVHNNDKEGKGAVFEVVLPAFAK